MKPIAAWMLAVSVLATSGMAGAHTTCPGELASPTTNFQTTIQFVNASTITVDVYWIDFHGKRVLYATLMPGQTYEAITYYQHVWAVTETAGDCIETATATAGPLNVEVH